MSATSSATRHRRQTRERTARSQSSYRRWSSPGPGHQWRCRIWWPRTGAPCSWPRWAASSGGPRRRPWPPCRTTPCARSHGNGAPSSCSASATRTQWRDCSPPPPGHPGAGGPWGGWSRRAAAPTSPCRARLRRRLRHGRGCSLSIGSTFFFLWFSRPRMMDRKRLDSIDSAISHRFSCRYWIRDQILGIWDLSTNSTHPLLPFLLVSSTISPKKTAKWTFTELYFSLGAFSWSLRPNPWSPKAILNRQMEYHIYKIVHVLAHNSTMISISITYT